MEIDKREEKVVLAVIIKPSKNYLIESEVIQQRLNVLKCATQK